MALNLFPHIVVPSRLFTASCAPWWLDMSTKPNPWGLWAIHTFSTWGRVCNTADNKIKMNWLRQNLQKYPKLYLCQYILQDHQWRPEIKCVFIKTKQITVIYIQKEISQFWQFWKVFCCYLVSFVIHVFFWYFVDVIFCSY